MRRAYNRLELNFPVSGTNPLAQTLPAFRITNLNNASGNAIGVATNLPQGRIANNYVVQDTMTYISGDHTLRFGVDFLRQISRPSAPFNSRGLLDYRAGGGFTAFANFVDDFGGSGPATGTTAIDFAARSTSEPLPDGLFFGSLEGDRRADLHARLRYETRDAFNTLRTPPSPDSSTLIR